MHLDDCTVTPLLELDGADQRTTRRFHAALCTGADAGPQHLESRRRAFSCRNAKLGMARHRNHDAVAAVFLLDPNLLDARCAGRVLLVALGLCFCRSVAAFEPDRDSVVRCARVVRCFARQLELDARAFCRIARNRSRDESARTGGLYSARRQRGVCDIDDDEAPVFSRANRVLRIIERTLDRDSCFVTLAVDLHAVDSCTQRAGRV